MSTLPQDGFTDNTPSSFGEDSTNRPLFLNELNDSQREAVEYIDGPSLVIAGAGSGKTRVLTYKIAYLLNRGYEPWNILALTFTNKAADEMKARIASLVGQDKARHLYMGTFHSIFSRILRIEADRLGYSSNFTIYDESDSRGLIKTIVKEMQLDEKVYKPASVHSRISMAKNKLDFSIINNDKQKPKLPLINNAYCERCRKANAMDFDDLILNMYKLLKEDDSIRLKYSRRFKFILVDEYQDTNIVQDKIILLLSEAHERFRHVCLVGDDDQSIYSFRGANIENMLNAIENYDGIKKFLYQNYRNSRNILNAADSLIKKNKLRLDKENYKCVNAEGDKIKVKPSYSDREEAVIVCNEIKRIRREEHCEYSDFAVLYRTNAQSRSFEEAMRKVGIPYRIYGGLSFYQRKEIKDIIAYFRLVVNPNDEEAFKRIINYPKRGIGDTTVNKIAGLANINSVSMWGVVCEPERYGLSVNKGTLGKLTAFRSLIEGFIEKFAIEDAYVLALEIVKAGGISADIYSDTTPEGVSRQENVNELLGSIQEFVESRKEEDLADEIRLTDFLQEVSLQTDLESDDEAGTARVSLMTVHSAKGLEFPTVFIVGLEENIFPSMLSMNSRRELEEERRLLYVAITRAEKHCFITYAQNRYRYGKMEMEAPSRFIKDIDPKLLLVDDIKDIFMKVADSHSSRPSSFSFDRLSQNSRPVASQFMADRKPREVMHRMEKPVDDTFSPSFRKLLSVSSGKTRNSSSATPVSDVKENSIIEHERFGLGTVIRIEGTGENTKATVQFKNTGVKQLLLKFARFKIIG